MKDEMFAKKVRSIDLALHFGRKKQSSRTGFIHGFSQDDAAFDVIAMYENFCFALLLMRQKTADSVLEAKELLDKLLHFQTPNGNFPVFLHDYPRCWDAMLPLKIAPALIYLLRGFSSVLGCSLQEKMQHALKACLNYTKQHREEKGLTPLWEMRYHACIYNISENLDLETVNGFGFSRFFGSFGPTSAEEWFEWVVSMQLLNRKIEKIPYDRSLQMFFTEDIEQEKGEPKPLSIEWILAESDGYSERLLRDHQNMLYTALLWPISEGEDKQAGYREIESAQGFQIYWSGKKIHSFCLPKGKTLHLPQLNEWGRGDLVEVEAFCDLGCSFSVAGKTGTVFQLDEWIEIEADGVKISFKFTLKEGIGEFCGHISKGNRPSQIACKGPLLYEVFDWRIYLRTLRKSTPCIIQTEVVCSTSASAFRASERLSIASPIA